MFVIIRNIRKIFDDTGKTPMQTFIDSIPLAKEKMLNNTLQTQQQTEGTVCQVK